MIKQSEHTLQTACVNYFRYNYPALLIFAIPNGGKRNHIVAAKLKEEGVMAGVPDLFIPVINNGYGGLFIEIKAGKNKPTKKQVFVMQQLTGAGYKCAVCYSFEEFKKILNGYLIEK